MGMGLAANPSRPRAACCRQRYTQPVANLNFAGDSNPYQLTVFKDNLYFFAADGNGLGHNQLWKTNGTASKTTSLGSVSDNAFYLTAAGGPLYFTANDSGGAYQVWRRIAAEG